MLLAFGPQDLQRLAIPIGVGIAVLLIVLVPVLRRSVFDSFMKGHEAGAELRGTQEPDGPHRQYLIAKLERPSPSA